MHTILIVEDDRTLSEGITLSLKNDKFTITQQYTYSSAIDSIAQNHFDLIILDINLPDGNGIDLLKVYRKTSGNPVILLTANDLEADIVTGLELGANDYITKPFSLAVLRARVNNQLRGQEKRSALLFNDFSFDFEAMEFFKSNIKIELSKTEQKLLKILVENENITLTREQIIDTLWSGESEYVDANTLSVTIKRLRDKLEDDPSKPSYIQTVYGIGYAWRKSQ